MIIDPITIRGRNCENANPEDWFPTENKVGCGGGAAMAARLCEGCPALVECLEWALHHEAGVGAASRFGIYGGTTGAVRAKIARKREKAA